MVAAQYGDPKAIRADARRAAFREAAEMAEARAANLGRHRRDDEHPGIREGECLALAAAYRARAGEG